MSIADSAEYEREGWVAALNFLREEALSAENNTAYFIALDDLARHMNLETTVRYSA